MTKIGVFDSGFGGLTVVKELAALPHQLIYLGDTARLPYGTKSREAIIRYSLECCSYLVDKESNSSSLRATPQPRWH